MGGNTERIVAYREFTLFPHFLPLPTKIERSGKENIFSAASDREQSGTSEASSNGKVLLQVWILHDVVVTEELRLGRAVSVRERTT